jgi:hypothetical protein
MHEPIEGLLARLKKIESRSRIGAKTGQNHVAALNKGAIVKREHKSTRQPATKSPENHAHAINKGV